MATHSPHEEWCDFCMSGRGRNKAHRRKKRFCTGDVSEEEPDTAPIPSEGPVEGAPRSNPVPRVCMDYFYVSGRPRGAHRGAHGMSTKEFQKRLKEMGKSTLGRRNVLVERYERYKAQEEADGASMEEAGEAACFFSFS